MPNLPVIESKKNINTEVATYAPVADTSKSDMMKVVGKGIENVNEIALKWQEANDTMQYTTAKANYETGMADILNRANNDPDYNNSGKYTAEMDDLLSKSTQGFSNKQLEKEVGIKFGADSKLNKIKLDNIFRNKTIEYTRQVTLPNSLSALTQKKLTAGSPQEYQQADLEMKELVAANVKSGVIDNAEGAKLISDAQKTMVETDIYNNPDLALAELKKGSAGIYKDLSAKERIDYQESADARIKKIKSDAKEAKNIAYNQREGELIDMKINGTLTETIVREDRESDRIDPKTAESLINSLRNPKKPEPSNIASMTKYNELVERNLLLGKKENSWLHIGQAPFEEITQYRADVLDANAKGLINDKEMSDLLSSTAQTFYRKPVFQNALDRLKEQSTIYASKDMQVKIKSEMYGSLLSKVQAGDTPEKAVEEVIYETQIKYNPNRGKYSVGQVVSLPNGRSFKVTGYDADGEPTGEYVK